MDGEGLQGEASTTGSGVPLLSMPPTLSFESWWQESGKHQRVFIDYDTASQACTAT